MSPSTSDITAVIRDRRTIKPAAMSDREISSEDLLLLLENAHWAPTHGMTEPWRFKVFRKTSRIRLADHLQHIYKKVTPEDAFKIEKYEKLGSQPLMSPVVIAICMVRDPREKIHELDEIAAVACAVQNLHLTATARRMAGFWSTPPFVFNKEMNTFLEIGPADKCLGLFYLGWPKKDELWPVGKRSDFHTKFDLLDS